MRILLKAAFRSRSHLVLVCFASCSLLFLTLASQLEMFSLGVLTNNGADFFALFPGEGAGHGGVALSEVETKWPEISMQESGEITRESATRYLSSKPADFSTNPLSWVLYKIKEQGWFSGSFTGMILLLVVVSLFKAVWLFFSRYAAQLLSIQISKDLRQQYFSHIQALPMSFYAEYNIGSLSSRVVGDAGQISLAINSWIRNYVQTPFTLISSLSVCFYISWKLSLVIFIGVPLLIAPISILTRRVKKVSRQLQTNQEKFATVLQDFLAGIQTVKIFAMEGFSFKKYKEQNDKMAHLESKAAKYALLARPILHAITTLCLAVIVLFGLYVLGMSVSQLLVFCGILHLVYEPVKQFAEENANVQRGVVAAERMFEVLKMKPSIQDKHEAIDLKEFKDKIEFDHVWFRYKGEWILQDVSFTVKKGQTVALVGPTGSGKSTLAQLIPRLYEVEKGEIRIDGKPLCFYTQKSLREQIAFVSQRPFLFLDTIEENIKVGRSFHQEVVEKASRQAHAEEFICRLPQKYHTMLTDTGQNLSGGQQQRLAIARALARNAPILIMDEATSALDALSENHIKQAINALQGKVTQILIAHRLSTIEHADKIIYIDQGKKLAEGTKEELLASFPPFKAVWDAMYQTGGAELLVK